VADLDRVFKAMKRNGFVPRVIMQPGRVDVFAAEADADPLDTPTPIGEGPAAADLDAELQAWRERDQGGS
jgi:hypothetical protein